MSDLRTCANCGRPVPAHRRSQSKYCSPRCGIAKRANPAIEKLRPVTRKLGGIGELTVCANLLRSGFAVFRAVADHEDCDVVAIKDGKVYRVEVKTCRRLASGKIVMPQADPARFDVLAAIDHFGCISYLPPFAMADCAVIEASDSGTPSPDTPRE